MIDPRRAKENEDEVQRVAARESRALVRVVALACAAELVAGCARELPPVKADSAAGAEPGDVPTVVIPTASAAPESLASDHAHEPDSGKPGWHSEDGGYCVAKGDTVRPVSGRDCGEGAEKLSRIQPSPPGPHRFVFDSAGTEAERRRVPDACCYHVVRRQRGRPLVAAADERAPLVAGAQARTGWTETMPLDVERFAPDVRERAAEAWSRDAALEHASIAEFSRVALSMLALGAPAELVAEAHAAALDEVRHARFAYAVASAFACRTLGPGPLEVGRAASPSLDLVSFVRDALDDGCIGETLAALEVAVAAARCEEGPLADELRAVAEDESRHAALAYRSVAWAWTVATADERPRVAELLDERLEAVRSGLEPESLPDPVDAVEDIPGKLGPREASIVRREGLATVVLPALESLRQRFVVLSV